MLSINTPSAKLFQCRALIILFQIVQTTNSDVMIPILILNAFPIYGYVTVNTIVGMGRMKPAVVNIYTFSLLKRYIVNLSFTEIAQNNKHE